MVPAIQSSQYCVFRSDNKRRPWITRSVRVGNQMRKARLATVLHGAGVQLAIASAFSRGKPRATRESLGAHRVERRLGYGLLAVAGTFPPVYRCAKFVCNRDAGASC